MSSFVAIDFETANESRSSACAIGGVIVDEGKVTGSFYELIRPDSEDNYFHWFNIQIHGITPEMVENKPTFDTVWESLKPSIGDRILIAHNTAFDMYVLMASAAAYDYDPGIFDFACSYRLAKAMWSNLWSFRLDVLAAHFDIPLDHHNPLSDAGASAAITLRVCDELGVSSINEAVEKLGYRLGKLDLTSYSPYSNSKKGVSGSFKDLKPTGNHANPGNPIYGKVVAFTGTMSRMSRREAAQAVVDVGGFVVSGLSKNVSFLIVGMTDFRVVKDGMSSKLRKAVNLAEKGTGIEIIDEEEFLRILKSS